LSRLGGRPPQFAVNVDRASFSSLTPISRSMVVFIY
jgi:hypothetical protein